MASLTRRMTRRNVRAKDVVTANALKNNKRGINIGVHNPKAPKPLSLPARGSRRGLKNNWRSAASK